MKKVIIALCSASVIIACNILTPMTVCAGNRNCGHTSYVVGAYLDPTKQCNTYLHQYLHGHGDHGPIYETCTAHYYYSYRYPQCSICGDVDFSSPQYTPLYTEHENCGAGIIPYN